MKSTDWSKLGFAYRKTNSNIRCHFKDGEWGKPELHNSDEITLPISSTCLHYGQEIFEGLKAFRGKNGDIRLFRPYENAKRLNCSASYLLMPELPEEMFISMIKELINANLEFVPPFGSGASLYIRPFMIGVSPIVGVKPSTEYIFMIYVTPVGPYFPEGFKPTDMVIYRHFDRAAPNGTGKYKVGGNYAASLFSGKKAHDEGYSSVLYLDAKEKKYIDECGPANFFAIRDKTYITPKSESILPSITNDSLVQLAQDLGLKVERRPVLVEELETFDEAGACGTAAVISPIRSIFDADKEQRYYYGDEAGEWSTKLYNRLQGIQQGEAEDSHNWVLTII
ncbi:MAG: branched-chain amino acid aminotransferase [Bacteroidales bacterium]